jgi:hypothetical protein
MSSFQAKMGSIAIVVSFSTVAAILSCNASAQPAPGPATIRPGPLNRPDIPMKSEPIVPPRLSGEQTEAFRKSMADYQQCIRDKAAELRLSEAADSVISLRDRRTFWELELKKQSTLRSRYPKGFEQMLSETFNEYRSLGGTAATTEAVRPMASPCTNPWETFRGPSVPLIDSRQKPVAPR